MATRADVTDEAIRLQVLLERVKAGEHRRIDAMLVDEAKLLRTRLTRANLSAGQRDRIERLLEEIGAALQALRDRHSAAFRERLDELAGIVADTEAKTLAAALGGFDTAVPTHQVMRAAVNAAPLGVRGPGGGLLLGAFLSKHAEAEVERVAGVIRRGYFEGQTTDDIVRTLIGTKAAGYRDGLIEESRRHARMVAHTAVQHVAHVARVEGMKANADILEGYRWISALDSRTSEVCQSLDRMTFKLGEGPLPPAHPNCRSTIVPITKTFRELGLDVPELPEGTRASVDGQVPASLTYFEWLKQQPASFVEEALGPTRAKLFADGGLSAEAFAKLQLGRNFEPLTLEEMRAKAPKVFERAGL